MAENKKIRLSRVAKEYNVGIGTIAEFLEKKGIVIEHSPNVVLEDRAYDLVTAEFGGSVVPKANISERLRVTNEKVTIEDVAAKKVEVPEEEVRIKSNVFTNESERSGGLKILGKIDLDGKKPVEKTAEKPVEKPVEKPIEKTIEKVAEKPAVKVAEPVAKVEVAVKAEVAKAAEKEEHKETKKAEVKAEVKSEVKPEVKSEPKVEVAKTAEPVIATQKTESKPVVKADAPVESGVTSANGTFRANEPEKLSGPKILGKMVLPVANHGGDNKGKRNRIKKNRVDVANHQGGAQGQGGQGAQGGQGGNAQGGQGGRPQGGGFAGGGQRSQGGGFNNNAGANKKKGGNNNRVVKPIVKEAVSEEEVQKQIKETLSRLTSKGGKTKSSKYRRDKRDAVAGRIMEEAEREMAANDTLKVTEFVTVSELATMMDVAVTEVITACMNLGLMVSINQRLDAEALAIVAEEFGFKVEFVSVDIQEAIDNEEVDTEEMLQPRSPIVTVMGHVDHGKTSLLDYIRKANVIAGEAGGITQHIGAYSVKLEDGRKVTFLDTPGHEAFTAMRARGANVTDVAIIIVAADDAIMPQTKEAINHAEAAGVPIVFAINKIDKESANAEKIKEQLAAMNYLVEDWGGKYQSQDISAKKGLNIDKLLEKVALESELLNLRANPNRKATGSVIESSLDKGRGYVTTILVQNGTLKVGDIILSGIYTGRVKAMFDERGQKVETAPPSTPVLVLGLNGAPQAGDTFNVMDDDKSARDIATKREQLQRMQGLRTQKHITLDEIGRRIAIGNFKELNVILKGDVDGSIEALTDSLIKLSNEEVQVNVIHKAVGQISESDVLLAAASNAVVIGFQVRPSSAARRLAEKEEIEIRLYSIIYDAINEIKDAIEGMLAPETKEEITCSVEVLEVFKISKVGSVAGCMVREGKITRNSKIRVIRDGIVVYTGKLGSLKRFKDDVKEVANGLDCGLNVENFNDIKVGDFIEGYQEVEVARKL